jgi:hypothetical protein
MSLYSEIISDFNCEDENIRMMQRLEAGFMTPDFVEGMIAAVETCDGCNYMLAEDVIVTDLMPEDVVTIVGESLMVRLSAGGFLDCTDYTVINSVDDLVEWCKENDPGADEDDEEPELEGEDEERELWADNDEGLYRMRLAIPMTVKQFVHEHREAIDAVRFRNGR